MNWGEKNKWGRWKRRIGWLTPSATFLTKFLAKLNKASFRFCVDYCCENERGVSCLYYDHLRIFNQLFKIKQIWKLYRTGQIVNFFLNIWKTVKKLKDNVFYLKKSSYHTYYRQLNSPLCNTNFIMYIYLINNLPKFNYFSKPKLQRYTR